MTILIAATVENGVLRPERPLELPEGARVQLWIYAEPPAPAEGGNGLATRSDAGADRDQDDPDDPLAGVIGIGDSGVTDGADNHDRLIYGKLRP